MGEGTRMCSVRGEGMGGVVWCVMNSQETSTYA